MSVALVANLGSASVDASLAEIDVLTKLAAATNDGNVSVGPFGVLRMAASSRETIAEAVHDMNDSSSLEPQLPDINVDVSNPFRPAPVMDWFDPILGFDSTLHWADLFGLDFDSGNALLMHDQPSAQPEFMFDNLLQYNGQDLLVDSTHLRPQDNLNNTPLCAAQGLDGASIHNVTVAASQHQHPIFLVDVESVAEAQFLLKHFHDSVIPHMSFMPSNSKSPWTIMHLPEAMRTLSDLSYMHTGTLNHANAANMYGILACSAYHLSLRPSPDMADSLEYWGTLSNSLKESAKRHMQISLREELIGPKKAKYKDQLMAILSMLAFTVSYCVLCEEHFLLANYFSRVYLVTREMQGAI
jgi:arginine metabolism regulation protein II